MECAFNILKISSERIKKVFWILGFHAFLLVLIFILTDFIMGGFVFYKYVLLPEEALQNISGSALKFNDSAYQRVISELQAREQISPAESSAD